jgi:A/G-specific adenine glycosylase
MGSYESRQEVRHLADQLLSKKHPGLFNQAMMDLGATVCTPRNPSCPSCPLKDRCMAEKLGLQEHLPVSIKRPALLHKHITAAILLDRKKRVLMVQRPASGLLGGLWKFPGGERRAKEASEEALARTVREELGVSVRVEKAVALVRHAYTHFRVTFHVYRCAMEQRRPKAAEKRRWMWVSEEELQRLALSKAERKILGVLHS